MNEHTPTADNNKRRHLQSMIFFFLYSIVWWTFFPLSRPNYYNSFFVTFIALLCFCLLGYAICLYLLRIHMWHLSI